MPAPLIMAAKCDHLRAIRLGRRQVVRQRILIPSFGGSNPPAPANQINDLAFDGLEQTVTFAGVLPQGPFEYHKFGSRSVPLAHQIGSLDKPTEFCCRIMRGDASGTMCANVNLTSLFYPVVQNYTLKDPGTS